MPPDSLDEGRGLERLPEHLVGAVAVLGDVGRAGHDDDGDPGLPELAEERIGCLPVEMHVEEHDVGTLRCHGVARLLERPGLPDVELLQLEVHPAEEPEARIVLHDQYGSPPVHGRRSYVIVAE